MKLLSKKFHQEELRMRPAKGFAGRRRGGHATSPIARTA
jgi:hypothetical protein